jgi:hypothetical protein
MCICVEQLVEGVREGGAGGEGDVDCCVGWGEEG